MMKETLKSNKKDIIGAVPMGRLGTSEDMAGVILYLSSKASCYVTGALIPVDGGVLISARL